MHLRGSAISALVINRDIQPEIAWGGWVAGDRGGWACPNGMGGTEWTELLICPLDH